MTCAVRRAASAETDELLARQQSVREDLARSHGHLSIRVAHLRQSERRSRRKRAQNGARQVCRGFSRC